MFNRIILASYFFKKLFVIFVLSVFLTLSGSNYLYSEEQLDPEKFVISLYNEINDIALREISKSEKVSEMLYFFDNYVDLIFISRAVLGPSWKSSSDAEKSGFSSAFKNYMAKKYVGQFGDFDSGDLHVEKIKKQGSKGFLIETKIYTNKPKPFNVSWQAVVGKTGLKLINIKFQGISMIHSERTEIRSLLKSQSGSIPLLIAELNNY